jgi:hypothetical protein
MFIFLIQKGGFKLFDLDLAQQKVPHSQCQWCPLLLSNVCLSSKGLMKDWEEFKRIQVGNLFWSTIFLFTSI